MVFRFTLFVYLQSLVMCQALSAQSPDDDLPSANEIIRNYIDARGGEQQLFGLSSLQVKGHVDTLQGPSRWHNFELHWKDGRWRSRFTGESRNFSRGRYGGRFWVAKTPDSPAWANDEENRRMTCINREPDLSQSWLQWDGEITVEGREPVGDRDTWRVEFVHDNGFAVTRWFDAETGLVAQTSYLDGGERLTTTSDEYRDVDGVLFSVKATTTYANSDDVIQVVFDEIVVNSGFPDSRVVPPAALLD